MAFSTKSLVGFVTENDKNKQCRWQGWYLLCFADRRCLLAIWRFKEKHFIWVHVFSTKALIADTIWRILLEMVTPFYVVILTTWRPSRLQEKGGTLISQWKTRSIGPAPGIKPKTSRSEVKRTTDWSKLAAVKVCSILHVFQTCTKQWKHTMYNFTSGDIPWIHQKIHHIADTKREAD